MGVTIRCSLFLWTAPYVFRLLRRFLRMSFFYPCPGISPQRRQAHIFAQSYSIRTVIQFSICPSIGSQREGPKINPVCKFFELCLQRQKEPVHSTSNQREKISRSIFDETMYRLCFSETFNVCFFRSAGRPSDRSGTAAIPFDGCLVFHFRYSVVDSAMRAEYSIAYRTLVRQVILTYCSRKSGCRFRQPTLQKLSLINMGFSDSSKKPQYLLQFPPKRLSAVRHPSAAVCPRRI